MFLCVFVPCGKNSEAQHKDSKFHKGLSNCTTIQKTEDLI